MRPAKLIYLASSYKECLQIRAEADVPRKSDEE
jgi:hypothetical protein